MKVRPFYWFSLLIFAIILMGSTTGCAKKIGCDPTANAKVKLKKDGTPRGKPSTGLFDRKTRRKMKRN